MDPELTTELKSEEAVTDERAGVFTPDKKRGTADGAGRAAFDYGLAGRRPECNGCPTEPCARPPILSTHPPHPVAHTAPETFTFFTFSFTLRAAPSRTSQLSRLRARRFRRAS